MKRQFAAVILAACILHPAAADTRPTFRQAQGSPNIIFLVADDQGYADLGCYQDKPCHKDFLATACDLAGVTPPAVEKAKPRKGRNKAA